MMTRSEFLLKSALFEVWCFQELKVKIICFTFYRSPEDQLIEYHSGRSQLKEGKHQKWLAKDYALFDDIDGDWICDKDEIRWRDDPIYQQMGEEWERKGGIWGGKWSFRDIYHFEG